VGGKENCRAALSDEANTNEENQILVPFNSIELWHGYKKPTTITSHSNELRNQNIKSNLVAMLYYIKSERESNS